MVICSCFPAVSTEDLHNGRPLEPLRANSHDILHIAFSRGGSLVATADDSLNVYLWDTYLWDRSERPFRLTLPTDSPERPGFLAFGGNGAWLATGASTLQLLDLDLDSLHLKLCALLREPGQHGADSPTPLWRSCERLCCPLGRLRG
jgi:hypothetical protein